MARPGRPVSESYQPVSYSVSQSASYNSEAQEDGDDQAPIFSLSKSSMDVVMAHKRDPAWTRLDLRRSSSTNTHSDQSAVTLQQLHPHVWQHVDTASSHQQVLDTHGHPALSERWITNMHRWSGSTLSRSSTPDTVVWKGGTSRPCSLTQETPCSPMSKTTSPPTTPSPFISPLQTPTSPPDDPFSSPTLSITHQQEDFFASSPLPSPLQAHASSPLASNSPNLLQPASTEDEDFLENNSLFFRFPSPIPSSASLAGEEEPSDPRCLADDVMVELHRPGGTQLSEAEGVRGAAQTLSYMVPDSPTHGQEEGRGATVNRLDLPWEPVQSCPTGRVWRSPLVSSLSDSLLGDQSNLNATKAEALKEKGTMTSQLELVDAAVQTSPVGSLWGLRRNTSNVGSHSFLGSPPGSRLNLKSSVGSNSNLVSPSSSMFPASSGDEEEAAEEQCRGDDPTRDFDSVHNQERRRRRSCLKMVQDEERNAMRRRSSMKQVQWDEDGMTWDIHGASQDLEVLSTAIQKHLERQNSPKPLRPSSKKKKAPKPPLLSTMVKAMTPELHPPVMIITSSSTCAMEGESEKIPDGVRKEAGEETVDARRLSRAEAAHAKEEDEVYREEGTGRSELIRKRSGIRSLRRPGWCGGSSKAND